MAPKETKISKQAVAGTSHIILTIPKRFETIRKHGSATSQIVIMAAYNNRVLNI
jgi:hypothetical protein